MVAESKYSGEVDFARMCSLFGRYFQIRDDYQNLTSDDVRREKSDVFFFRRLTFGCSTPTKKDSVRILMRGNTPFL
jgi:hypothetical protein